MMEDTRIIELFFERDQQAIQELDTKYGKVCHKLSYNIVNNRYDARFTVFSSYHRLSYNIVNNRYDAEECVNDAYLGAWNTIPPTKPQSLQAYICKIVRNISLKLLYRNEAAKRKSVCEVAMQEMEAYLPAQNTVEAEIEAKELAAIIDAFLDTLSVENRIIFMRRYAYFDYKSATIFCSVRNLHSCYSQYSIDPRNSEQVPDLSTSSSR